MRSTGPETGWTEDLIERLRRHWDEGLSAAQIGRRLGMSRSAIIGKARRLELSARASPVGGRSKARREADEVHPPPPAAVEPRPAAAGTRPVTADTVMPNPAPACDKACCWPLGEPGRTGFRFCGSPTLPDKPYCAAHCALAYAAPRPSAEKAATPG